MKATELRDLEAAELEKRLDDQKQALFNLRFQLEAGQLENHTAVKKTKRDIARINTILREKESSTV